MVLRSEAKRGRIINIYEWSSAKSRNMILIQGFHLHSSMPKNVRNKTYAPLSFSSQMQRFHGVSTPHIYMLKPFTQKLFANSRQWHQHWHVSNREESCSAIQCSFVPIIIDFCFQVDRIAFFKAQFSGTLSIKVVQSLTWRQDRRSPTRSCCRRMPRWWRWMWAPSRWITESRTANDLEIG